MAVNISTEIALNVTEYNELEASFLSALNTFESASTAPGTGFNVEAWTGAIPDPTFTAASLPEVNAGITAPTIAAPALLAPSSVATLAAQGYDSAYLTAIADDITSILNGVIDEVLPVSLVEAYFRTDRASRARAAADKVDAVLDTQARRGFPSMTHTAARQVTEVLSEWQDGTFAVQDNAAVSRLDLAQKIHIAALSTGINLESLRARFIATLTRYYNDYNGQLVRTYKHLIDEKLGEGRVALNAATVALEKAAKGVELQSESNRAEIELPSEIFRRARVRIEQEFSIDAELVSRRKAALEKITATYGSWAIGTLGQAQSMAVGRHKVAQA